MFKLTFEHRKTIELFNNLNLGALLISKNIGCYKNVVQAELNRNEKPYNAEKAQKLADSGVVFKLDFEMRQKIEVWVRERYTVGFMARMLKCDRQFIDHELRRGGGKNYSAELGEKIAAEFTIQRVARCKKMRELKNKKTEVNNDSKN